MSERKIVRNYDPKPIPARIFDWIATRDGWEPGSPYGCGATEDAAIADLLLEEGMYE